MLVTIFLRGGADTLNLLVPYGDDAYYRVRPTLAIAPPGRSDGAIRLSDLHALHPALAPLVPFWDEGRLAFVQGVGCDDTSGSHFVAQEQVERGEAMGQELGGGWLARYLRAIATSSTGPLPAIAIGERIPNALGGAPQVAAMRTLDDLRLDAAANADALAALYEADPLLADPARSTFELIARVDAIRRAPSSTAYPAGRFGDALRETARLARAGIGLEVACIDLDGWDTHFVQGPILAAAATTLAKGLSAFLGDLGSARDAVTVVVMTEFGRRTYENGSAGTDHGRGHAMMILGSKVRGGRVHGSYLGLEEPDCPGPGGLAIAHDYRDVLAEVVGMLGHASALPSVFPGFTPRAMGLAA